MQPGDENETFSPPEQTNYFEPAADAPVAEESPLQEAVDETSDSGVGNEPVSPEQVITENVEPIQWTAPEYIHRQKSPVWFVAFGLVVIGLMGVAIFLMKTWTFALLIPVMAGALIAYTYRPPRQVNYVLSEKGLYINDVLHNFAKFKGFGILHEATVYSMEFIPVHRFLPRLSIYFPQEKGEAIVDLLGVRLPMQTIKPDAFDRIIRLIGF